MKLTMMRNKNAKTFWGDLWKLTFIVLVVFSLILLPYKVDMHKGKIDSSVLLADDGGDGGGDGGGGDGGGDVRRRR